MVRLQIVDCKMYEFLQTGFSQLQILNYKLLEAIDC